MAYMSQERKKSIAPKVKKVLAKYGVKGTLAVRNHSTLVLNIKSGKLDFIGNFNDVMANSWEWGRPVETRAKDSLDVNPYHYEKHYSGEVLEFFEELFPIMNAGNHDNSDIQTDYFDVGWYVDVNVGNWDKPYNLEA
jgi:hypothetical protein